MSLRREFCELASQDDANVSALCKRFRISRKTGYKMLERFRAEGEAGLANRSRRPTVSPRLSDPVLVERVLALRTEHPTWGGRKLKRRLEDLGETAPAASTITEMLRRAGCLDPAKSAQHRPFQRFVHAAPNDLWQMDFKGHVAMGTRRCHPFMVADDHSRYVVGLTACADESTETVQALLTAMFRRYGMPWRILCDNGSPWGTVHAESGLTTVSAWLTRLGIRILHGRPYHPQTQGKLERLNRTLAEDVLAIRLPMPDVLTTPSFPDLATYQRAFDHWRAIYNRDRPHEALGLATPSTRYTASSRSFPETLPPVTYEDGDHIRKVDHNGVIWFKNDTYRMSKALVGELVGLRATTTDGVWEVRYCHVIVRTLDLRGPRNEDRASSITG